MKKKICYAMTFLFLMSFLWISAKETIFAAGDSVTSVTATGTVSGVTVKGTTDAGVVAVAIEIFDENNQLVAMETHAVTDGAYNATIAVPLTAEKSYKAYVINYSGAGTAKESSFTVPKATTPGGNTGNAGNTGNNGNTTTNTPSNQTTGEILKSPKTGLDPMVGYGAMAFVLLVGGFTMWFMLKNPTHK